MSYRRARSISIASSIYSSQLLIVLADTVLPLTLLNVLLRLFALTWLPTIDATTCSSSSSICLFLSLYLFTTSFS